MEKTIFSILIMSFACAIVFMSPSNVISGQKHMLRSQLQAAGTKCKPTPSDYLGLFYKAGAPVHASVGTVFELNGVVRSSANCVLITNAKIELWLTAPGGDYDDDHRATIHSDVTGAYSFESNFPPAIPAARPISTFEYRQTAFEPWQPNIIPKSVKRQGNLI